MKAHVKTKNISIYLKDVHGKEKDQAIYYRGSAWTLSVEDDGIQIYKNGQSVAFHQDCDIINVVENG